MTVIQEVFNNREIAIGIWLGLIIIPFLFTTPARKFIKSIIPILFSKKFVTFYAVFFSFLCLVLYGLHWIGIWEWSLLKDTIFWVLCVEFPLFMKAIEKADSGHFFGKLIKENIAVSVIIEFFIGFWTFSLPIELVLVPLTVIISLLYAVSEREKTYRSAKKFFGSLQVIWGIVLIINAINELIHSPEQFFNMDTLKSLGLPIVLLILNLPIVYGLALYNIYEQIFIRLKGNKFEQRKMKVQLLFFSGLNLSKVTAVRKSMTETIMVSLTANDLRLNLNKLSRRLQFQIGDNYMKPSRYYTVACMAGLIISIIGLIGSNSEVSIKELISMNFVWNVPRIKEIATYIFSTMFVFSMTLLIFAGSFRKRQRTDVSQIKKYALYELLMSAKRQESQLMEYPPTDDPTSLFVAYILNANEVKAACNKVLSAYENLLTSWEWDTINQLQLCSTAFINNFEAITRDGLKYNAVSFSEWYNVKKLSAPQNEKINTFVYTIQKDLEKYSESIQHFCKDFESYY